MKKYISLLILSCFLIGLSNHAFSAQQEYFLGVGDTIKIQVYEEPDLTFEITIDNSGVFSYPYLKQIKLVDKTVAQLEEEITAGLLERVLKNPNVTVNLVKYRSFSIGGEVIKPGSYAYEPGLTVIKAINLAGGPTEWSTGKKFKLDREKPTKGEKFTLNSKISPGDVLTVLPRGLFW